MKAIESVATKLGIGSTETLRKWIRKAEVDAGQRPWALSVGPVRGPVKSGSGM